MAARRAYGSGSLFEYRGAWYGQWRAGGRLVKRKIGPRRKRGTREGLTRTQAEALLRKLIQEQPHVPAAAGERPSVPEVGEKLTTHLKALGRKKSTTEQYDSMLREHIEPYFGDKDIAKCDSPETIERFLAHLRTKTYGPKASPKPLSTKSILNILGFLHSIFDYAQRKHWVTQNPCKLIDKPEPVKDDTVIRFLALDEIWAVLRVIPDTPIGFVDRVMIVVAVMTGLRQGELVGLRWQDIDWAARKVRAGRGFVRGEYTTPKGRRGRAVPLADRAGGELDLLFKRSTHQADDDLVFAHPDKGGELDRSKLLKRFKRYLRDAGVREITFHELRHTFGTRMAAAGVPIRTLQEWMGHRDIKTTMIYAHYAPSEHENKWVNGAFSGTATETGAASVPMPDVPGRAKAG